MSDSTHGAPLVSRVMRERKRTIVMLAALLAVNVIVFVGFVYPLAQRVANIQQRDQSA